WDRQLFGSVDCTQRQNARLVFARQRQLPVVPRLAQVLLQVSPGQTHSSDLGWRPESHLWVHARISASLSTTGSGFGNPSSCFLVESSRVVAQKFCIPLP